MTTLSRLKSFVAPPDVAIDLGNANTRVYALGRGLIADEPSVIAVSDGTGRVEAVGAGAIRLKDGGEFRHVFPMQAGVVCDVDAAASLLRPLLGRASGRLAMRKPRVLVCAPTDIKPDERDALIEATRRAGAASVTVAFEPLAAAIGAGLDIASPYAQMLVDIGDGITDIAVIRSGRLIRTATLRTACSDMHTAVRASVVRDHQILLFPREAERLTRLLGATRECVKARSLVVGGTDELRGTSASVRVTSEEVSDAIDPIVDQILCAVRDVVSDLSVKTACEVIESGISLTGGGAKLQGLARLIATETCIDVSPAADPMRAVIDGARQMLAVAVATGLLVS